VRYRFERRGVWGRRKAAMRDFIEATARSQGEE
jgi:hypothetical protein